MIYNYLRELHVAAPTWPCSYSLINCCHRNCTR